MTTPRGIRNNNPGNIDRQTPKRAGWMGAVPDRDLTDPRFEQFVAPEWGIRALARVLVTYQQRHNLRTVRQIIDRWAPPVENNTGAYVAQVAKALGVAPDAQINVMNPATMQGLVVAIIKHENGVQPYADAVIRKGLELAGIGKASG